MPTDKKGTIPTQNGSALHDRLMAQTIALDLEISRNGRHLKQIGAMYQGRRFEYNGATPISEALSELDTFGTRARYLLGHNILNHDLPFLKAIAPRLPLLELPVFDTLFLSPLAFPRNPYHRLVKDYKLVRSAVNDPLEDVRLAISVFSDQLESFSHLGRHFPEMLAFYAFCFQKSLFNGFDGTGLARIFNWTGKTKAGDDHWARDVFIRLTSGLICLNGLERACDTGNASLDTPEAAYSLAWLRVSGSNSVLPPWIRFQFPGVIPFLKALRETPCGDQNCPYCCEIHDPNVQLKRFFGFDAFRNVPPAEDGGSLQQKVVVESMRDQPLLAIFPTGGGKSLCYQLPALIRHVRRGLLTVVVSPLQALMKDQVDNLARNTGTPFAAGIYGLLTPPERGKVLEKVRMGDIAILYISPEQLRSRSVRQVLMQREIGCWVFDEAHCFSKWGHDFRPDYLYAARFIRELCKDQKMTLPPVTCYTATAKRPGSQHAQTDAGGGAGCRGRHLGRSRYQPDEPATAQ